jgi:uncharacterized surface protein with fasciclin (FAS1) repeats
VFSTPGAALSYWGPRGFSSFTDALKKAGLFTTLSSSKFSGTVFAPTNAAFTAASKAAAGLSTEGLKAVLLYHVLPEARTIPKGVQNGAQYETLDKGHKIGIKLEV